MWQSAIAPSDGKSIAGAICCLAILIVIHLGLIAALELPRTELRGGAEETLLFFEFPPEPALEPEPEEIVLNAVELEAPAVPQAPAEPEPQAALQTEPQTAPRTEQPALPVTAPEELPFPESGFGDIAGTDAFAGTSVGTIGSTVAAGSAGVLAGFPRGGARAMAETDYVALLLRRLEEKKVYPLAMRKRGIAGDVALFLTIRPDGSLASLRAGENPHPFLADAALQTARSAAPFPVWEGRRGEYSLQVTMRFQLE
jgi:TonB family protein